MTSQILGNLAAAFLLGKLTEMWYFVIMAITSGMGTFCFLFLKKPSRVAKLDSKLDGLHIVEETLDRTGSTGTDYVEQTVIAAEQTPSFSEDIKSVLRLLVSRQMMPLILQLSWSGFNVAIISGMLVPIITATLHGVTSSKQELFQLSMLAMVCLGVGEIMGAIGMGVLVDMIGAKKSCFLNTALVAL